MPSLKAKKVISSLLRKGFIKEERHHHYYEFWHNGQFVLKTYASHSGEDINAYLISAMSKQCNMDKEFFVAFINCAKSKEDYIQSLIEKIIITII